MFEKKYYFLANIVSPLPKHFPNSRILYHRAPLYLGIKVLDDTKSDYSESVLEEEIRCLPENNIFFQTSSLYDKQFRHRRGNWDKIVRKVEKVLKLPCLEAF